MPEPSGDSANPPSASAALDAVGAWLPGDRVLLFALLGLLVALLIWGRVRFDIVAFGILLAAVVLGLVPPAEAFLGFGHPATVTVALVLVMSRVLADTGATEALAR